MKTHRKSASSVSVGKVGYVRYNDTLRPTRDTAASVLFVVLPYMVESDGDTSKKGVGGFLAFPYGVLTMATYVNSHASGNPRATILDLNLYAKNELEAVLRERIANLKPEIVGISFTFDVSYRYILPLTRLIKQENNTILVVVGGTAATVSYADVLANQPYVDALCYGEGDVPMRRLVEAVDTDAELTQDPWVTRASLTAGQKPTSVTVEHLNEVLPIDYQLIDEKRYSMREAFSPFAPYRNRDDIRQYFLVTSRGCPFKCVFCAEPSFHGKTMRFADVDAIIAHVDHMVTHHGMNVLTMYDDQLLIDQRRAKELFRRLVPYGLRIEMPNGVTLVFIDEELATLMRQAGVSTIFLAIESGSDYVLREIIKKPIRISKVRPVIEALQRNEIFVQSFFINGFPGEREEDRQETLRFIKDVGIDWSYFNYATPLRGSELFEVCKKNGWIDEKYLGIGEIDMMSYLIRAPGIDPEHITEQTYTMNLDVNFVNNRRMKIGDYAVAARCFREVRERHPGQPFASWFLARSIEQIEHDPAEVTTLGV